MHGINWKRCRRAMRDGATHTHNGRTPEPPPMTADVRCDELNFPIIYPIFGSTTRLQSREHIRSLRHYTRAMALRTIRTDRIDFANHPKQESQGEK